MHWRKKRISDWQKRYDYYVSELKRLADDVAPDMADRIIWIGRKLKECAKHIEIGVIAMTLNDAIEKLTQLRAEDSVTKFFCKIDNEVVDEQKELIDICLDAINKQIPKKPRKHKGYCDSVFYKCDCNHEFDYKSPYCPHCGQAIDWSDSNE